MNHTLVFVFSCCLLPFFMSCDKDDDTQVSVCDKTAIIDNSLFDEDSSAFFTLIDLTLDGDCLNIQYSASGCNGESWELKLVDSGAVAESLPVQRFAKLLLENEEACLAVFTQEVSFDLSNLQVPDDDELILTVTGLGFEEVLSYQY